jgi:enoyl-[acyl-carrier protein] reductase I
MKENNMGFLTGKKALIMGLVSQRSIAYGIAQAMHREGATIALSYQAQKIKDRVVEMGQEWDAAAILECDVSSDESINAMFQALNAVWDKVDIIVHSIAFAPQDQFGEDYLDCINREGFRIAHDISSYSFSAVAKAARPMLSDKASLVTLSYLGGERTVQNYNVMGVAKASLEANMRYIASSLGPQGIRVNAVSAGPIKTLAAAGIKDFRKMLGAYEKLAPMKRNVTLEEVGNAAAFLCSDLASGITGEVIHVDGGFHMQAISDFE